MTDARCPSLLLSLSLAKCLSSSVVIFSIDLLSSQEIKKEIGSFIQQRLGSEIFGSYSKVWQPIFFASSG